jgi:molecular chaperone HtpG
MAKSKKKFKTEVQQLLDLVIHSLYSHREIFLRELISNSSDAIDKARFLALSDKSIAEPEGGWKIKLTPDSDAKTLTISDNGVGMDRDELDANLGTIANSGTKAFMESMAESKEAGNPDLIGQFGVGFYSAFMVADKVTVTTRKHTADAEGLSWESTGDGSYSVDTADKETAGTDIVLHFKEDAEKYIEEWELKQTVKKYSDYVAFPITMDTSRDEKPVDDEGKEIEGSEAITTVTEETLNSMEAIWVKPKAKVKKEEYNEFYKSISHDWSDPQKVIHWKAEAPIEFNAVLYIPAKAPQDLFQDSDPKGVNLYVKRVFIMNDCKDLVPPYLRFLKGVVDSSDLSLNVSREILQKDPVIQKMQKAIVAKVLSTLKQMQKKKKDEYLAFWNELGKVLKEGMHSDHGNKDKLTELILFQTSKSEEPISLREYVERMHPDQKEIYYITGENRGAVLNSPHLEAFRAKDVEVLLMTDPIDEWVAMSLPAYDEKQLKPIDRGDVDLNSEDEKEEKEKAKAESTEKYKDLLACLQKHLDENVKEVRLSDRLTDSPCVLVADEFGTNANMERIMEAMGQEVPTSKRILELNPGHPVMGAMLETYGANAEDDRLNSYADLLFTLGVITEGGAPNNPLKFAQLVSELMV